jgi:hypothetical protein
MADMCGITLEIAAASAVNFIRQAKTEHDDDLSLQRNGRTKNGALKVVGEARYGGLEALHALARQGLVFRGSHDAGEDTAAAAFAAHDGVLHYVSVVPNTEVPLVSVDRNCVPFPVDRAAVMAYYAADDAVKAALAGPARER